MSRKLLNAHVLLGSLLYLCSAANAQNDATSSPSMNDVKIVMPTTTGVLGRVDAGALQEITAHLKAVGAAPWTGMQGTGQITIGSDPASYPATLTEQGNTRFRLDVHTTTGVLSIRINGLHGKFQGVDGRVLPMLFDTAATGIFQFELPRLANFPASSLSLIDCGETALDGVTLHRVTFESLLSRTKADTQKPRTTATDLYFDLKSHLLVKSTNSIRIAGAGNNNFMRVITYGDYRKVDGSLIPFRFTQTLDGQKQWTFQLSDVQLKTDQPTTFFEF